VEHEFIRYLAAKRTVDDRALNRHVWEWLVGAVPPATSARPLRVLEVGAGIGTMVERLVEWGLLTYAAVTAIDAEPANVAEARRRLPPWAAGRGLAVAERDGGGLRFDGEGRAIDLELRAIDLFDFIAAERERRSWDLLVAHAVLDLLPIPVVLPGLVALVRPGGLLYLTITFDGATILQPEIDRALDDQIEALYHRTMDERVTSGRPSGDSRSGRHLIGHLRAAGATVLAAGASDWVVVAGPDGYPADEAYFLRFIVETMRGALQGHPELDAGRFAAWIAERHAQIERGELVYIAHQLDVLARAGGLSRD
jgi:SAM-dependent methyltransferase